MKLISYLDKGSISLGCIVNKNNKLVNISKLSKGTIPNNINDYLKNFELFHQQLLNLPQ